VNVLFVSPFAQHVVSYPTVLMLRDNLQHHLQAGRPSPGYPLIHAIADAALGAGQDRVEASELWSEVSLGLSGLRDVGIADLAMSIRTRALLTGADDMPVVRGTILLRLSGWKVPIAVEGMRTLEDLFAELYAGLDRVTASGRAKTHVQVTTPPR